MASFVKAFQVCFQPLWRLSSALLADSEVDIRLSAERPYPLVAARSQSSGDVICACLRACVPELFAARSMSNVLATVCRSAYYVVHMQYASFVACRGRVVQCVSRWLRAGSGLGLGLGGVIGILLSTPWESGLTCAMEMAC